MGNELKDEDLACLADVVAAELCDALVRQDLIIRHPMQKSLLVSLQAGDTVGCTVTVVGGPLMTIERAHAVHDTIVAILRPNYAPVSVAVWV